MDRYGLQTLRNRNSPSLTFFIFTLVVSEFLAYLLAMIFGTEPVALKPNIMSGVNIVHGIVISNWDIEAVCVHIRFVNCTLPFHDAHARRPVYGSGSRQP
jgi:branched-chain amino acid transport system permease protein